MLGWLNAVELFFHPSKQLPGKWKLFEYYTEPGNKLVNLKEEQLKKENQYWEINFERQGQLSQLTNLPVQFPEGISSCYWSVSRNFITWIGVEDSNKKEEFQYALVSGVLKLLKKKSDGKIEFFGFFRKIQEPFSE